MPCKTFAQQCLNTISELKMRKKTLKAGDRIRWMSGQNMRAGTILELDQYLTDSRGRNHYRVRIDTVKEDDKSLVGEVVIVTPRQIKAACEA